jgi:dienelactone hydrolase
MSETRQILWSFLLGLLAGSLPAGEWDEVASAARGLSLPAGSGGEAVLDALERRAGEVLGRLEHPVDRASWERRLPALRRELARALGIERLPEPRARGARVIGVLERGDHRLEKLVYETFPGTPVPAHLYLPRRAAGKLPAVLFVPGHWWADSKTRPDFQAFGIHMARLGFALLTYDPIGQGERGISLRDHRRTETLLFGIAQEGIVVFESLCALEYLLSRPEVDPGRAGITGASGGGFNTWMLAALEPRLAAFVPVVGTSEFGEQLRACRPLDWYAAKEHCHFVPGLLRFANNHELVAAAAPRPLLVIAAHRDESFPIPGIREVVEYGRRLYGALEAPDKLAYFEDEVEGHGYQRRKREAAYGWFLRWLKEEGDGGPVPEPAAEIPPYDAPELRCFPPGRNIGAGPGITAYIDALAARLPPPSAAPAPEELARRLSGKLGIEPHAAAPRLERGAARRSGRFLLERLAWRSADGLEIPALLLAPAGDWRGALIAAADGGKESLIDQAAVRAALEAGLAAALVDPRGLGELAVSKPGWVFAVSLLLGESFPGRQALDLIDASRSLAALPEARGKPIGLLGSGPFAAMAALYAAVLEPRIDWLVAERGFASYLSFAERERSRAASFKLAAPGKERRIELDREIPPALVPFDVFGGPEGFDIADLLAALEARPALLAAPIDGDGEELAEEEVRRLFARRRFAREPRAEVATGWEAGAKAAAFVRLRAEP